MIVKKLYFNIVVRVLLISINMFLVIIAFNNPKHIFSLVISIAFFILQIYLLIIYLNRINRNLANFLGSVLYKDGTFHLPEDAEFDSNNNLNSIINTISRDLKKSRIETEKQYVYLKTIIDHIDASIIVFDKDGAIDLVNKATLDLFKLSQIKAIKDLNIFYKDFSLLLLDLLPNIPKLLNVKIANEDYFLSVRVSVFKLDGKEMRLVSFHVINEEMNQAEIKSWEKLIRVLTHEIMNSVSPISSLTTTLTRIFKYGETKKPLSDLNDSDIDDTISGLNIINTRSKGLMDFIKKYRKVHLMPKPIFEEFEIYGIICGTQNLFQSKIDQEGIECNIEVYPINLTLTADKAMIEQVIINLVKNAMESETDKKKVIDIKAYQDLHNNSVVEIHDNGIGIPDDIKDDIFVPFFSTKKTGSGIGLSLVKQLVFLNKAKINVKSDSNSGTTFTIVFNK